MNVMGKSRIQSEKSKGVPLAVGAKILYRYSAGENVRTKGHTRAAKRRITESLEAITSLIEADNNSR